MTDKIIIVGKYLVSFLIGMIIGIIIISFVFYGGNKFCPDCGRRYDSKVEYCPIDGTELEEIVLSNEKQ